MNPFTGRSRTVAETINPSNNRTITQNTNRNILEQILNRTSRSNSSRIEELIDADDNIEVYSNSQLTALNPRVLYQVNPLNYRSNIYRHIREQPLSLPDDSTEIINLITPESHREIRNRGHIYIHLGLIAIGIRLLTRKEVGAMILLIIFDDRHATNDKAIIGYAEVDINTGLGIVYLVPDFNMTITDFSKHIKIAVQARGFENFTGSNIAIDIIFLGKTMTKIKNKFKNTKRHIHMVSTSMMWIRIPKSKSSRVGFQTYF